MIALELNLYTYHKFLFVKYSQKPEPIVKLFVSLNY